MKKKLLTVILSAALIVSVIAGCGSEKAPAQAVNEGGEAEAAEEAADSDKEESSGNTESDADIGAVLEDGVYSAKFTTDGSMFHVNEVYGDRGTLTVRDGEMTIHITLPSKNTVNLFPGTAEDAQKEGAKLLNPTVDTVNYDDGTSEEVNGFDVPVPVLDEEFDLALVGTKGKWYDHKVMVSDVTPMEDDEDMAKANEAAALIDAIYVQKWTEDTYQNCEMAKKAWDNLTDAQKELVEGEFADPDYFGNDTGDASKDDPLNGDDIGEKELLVVSFGTSFNESRAEDIGGIERALAAAFPEYSVRRAFTSQIIINHVYARDGEKIDNIDQALERAVSNGVKELVLQPTLLMHGAEYDEMAEALDKYRDKFEKVAIAEPLMGEASKDAAVINDDKKAVTEALTAQAVSEAGFTSLDEAEKSSTAFVFMGHGTSHTAKVTYSQVQAQVNELGYKNVFIGTVEGEPEETALENIIDAVKDAGYTKVVLRPLMVVAGDHANNDMAGDEDDSWKMSFTADGSFESVDCQIMGLGRVGDIQKLYVEHAKSVIE